jgi:hypothetical protein
LLVGEVRGVEAVRLISQIKSCDSHYDRVLAAFGLA